MNGAEGDEKDKDALYDVAEHITADLDGKVQVALQERASLHVLL